MSVIVTATFEGETFEVEIFHDGSLDFPGRDMEHEQTLAALGGDASIAIQFDESWTKSPTDVIFKNIELPENSTGLLAADYAEHVLGIYEDKHPGDLRPRAAIEAVRDFVVGKIDLQTLKNTREVAWAAAWAAWAEAEAWAARAAAEAWAARAAAEAWARAARAARAAAWAARAAAYNVSFDNNSVEWQRVYDTEVAWQIRRFVDVMEAVGQGLPWPPLEATE